MGRMPLKQFSKAIHKEMGTNHTVFVKHAIGGQPISKWDETRRGSIYTKLMSKVSNALVEYEDRELTSVTFIWMQGESDVIYKTVDSYLGSFDNLLYQLRRDLDYEDLRIIVGRINDWSKSTRWNELRSIQEFIGDTYQNATWVDTDDLNGPLNGIHTTHKQYKTLAQRYADIVLNAICEEE